MAFDRLNEPPFSSKPYIIPAFAGEAIYIPTSKSVMRLLITGASSKMAFGVVATDGGEDKPIGFHYHNDTHDVFLCLKGKIVVWAETQDGEKIREARILEPGDFASVPPKTIHQYQVVAKHSSFLGLIAPGGWEEFFRAIGDPYSGSLFPPTDNRPFHTTLLPRLKEAAEKHDLVPCTQHISWEPTEWAPIDSDTKMTKRHSETLPGALCPYFLKASSGLKWRVGGSILRRICGMMESNGRFTVAEWLGLGGPSDLPLLRFRHAHHCYFILEGVLGITLANNQHTTSAPIGTKTILNAGETASIPAGQAFIAEWTSRWGTAYIFCSERGFAGVLEDLGEEWEYPVVDQRGPGVDRQRLESLSRRGSFDIV